MLNLLDRRQNLNFVKDKAVKSYSRMSWEQTEWKTYEREDKNTWDNVI